MILYNQNGVLDPDDILARLYFNALREMCDENIQSAICAHDFLIGQLDNRRDYEKPYTYTARMTIAEWAHNIHNNTWPEDSLAGKIKTRVVLNRIKDSE